MTDLRKHLPGIVTAIRQHLAQEGSVVALNARLRALLPDSYGIGAGCLVTTEGQRSLPVDLVIYDQTIAPRVVLADPQKHELERALVVIALVEESDQVQLREQLQVIASVKKLRSRTEQALASKVNLKKLLPLGIVACRRLPELQSRHATPEALALGLQALLTDQDRDWRPDYLLASDLQLFYSNPLLTGRAFESGTINIAREPALKKPHPCYVCKQPFSYAHFFYHSLCLACGDLNYQKRGQMVDLTGRVALVTGARVKIGYATALRLLRAGARVIATTRFPYDAARRYSSEPDFTEWQDRLQIYGLDFRYLSVLERFVRHLHASYPALDILINNAAQTVRRPSDYYAHLLPFEQTPLAALTSGQQGLVQQSYLHFPPLLYSEASARPGMLPSGLAAIENGTAEVPGEEHNFAYFPAGHYDEYRQQLDLRERNSWTLPFNEIEITEFLEVQIINVTAPFLLVSHLHPLLRRSGFEQRFIVNVSAVEGQFANTKQGKHVHTNMAKASLNMLTHTAAAELARDRIYMNSVDPGWVSQQSPLTDLQDRARVQRQLPLDLLDAAARICDPIFLSLATGEAPVGRFYKNYIPTSW